jgi:hypothetical protein
MPMAARDEEAVAELAEAWLLLEDDDDVTWDELMAWRLSETLEALTLWITFLITTSRSTSSDTDSFLDSA